MIRMAAQTALTRHTNRFFVSSVLLSRTWENESVSVLKRELKDRGLSPKGNKSTLITRIQEHERQAVSPPNPRYASAAGVSPGIPSHSIREPSEEFTNINLPDLSQPDLETEVQIPFVPDFWDSSPAISATTTDPHLPKLLLVTGADTHHGGGPSLNIHEYNTDASSESTPRGFWRDVAQDIGISSNIYTKDTKRAVFDHILDASGSVPTKHSRTLDKDETRGVWALLGLVAGSWIIGGVVNRKRAEKQSTEE